MNVSYSGVHNNVILYNKIDDICKIVGIDFYKYAIDNDGLFDLYTSLENSIRDNLVQSLETLEKKFRTKKELLTNNGCSEVIKEGQTFEESNNAESNEDALTKFH